MTVKLTPATPSGLNSSWLPETDYNIVLNVTDGCCLYKANPLPAKTEELVVDGKRFLPSRWHSETRLKYVHVYYEQGHKDYQ